MYKYTSIHMHIYVGVCLYLCSKFLISLCPYDPLFIYQLPPNAATAPPGLGSCAEWQRAILERFSSLRQVPHESVLRARIKVYHKHANVFMHHEHANKHLLTHTNIYIYTHSYIYLHSYTYIHIHTYTHTHIHIHTHKYTYARTHTHTHTHTMKKMCLWPWLQQASQRRTYCRPAQVLWVDVRELDYLLMFGVERYLCKNEQ